MASSNVLKKLSLATAGAACIALGGVGTAHADTVIDTTPSWNGSSFIGTFGQPNTATYGQTFTVGSDNVLNDFSFFLRQLTASPLKFDGYLMAWDGAKATGNILYQSGLQSTSQQNVFQQFTFNTGGVSLTSGQKYVAFVNVSNHPDSGRGQMGFTSGDPLPGGSFVFLNNGSNFSQVTTTNWSTALSPLDAAFKATFTTAKAVPESSSVLGLLAVGALGASQVFKRKKEQ